MVKVTNDGQFMVSGDYWFDSTSMDEAVDDWQNPMNWNPSNLFITNFRRTSSKTCYNLYSVPVDFWISGFKGKLDDVLKTFIFCAKFFAYLCFFFSLFFRAPYS